MIRSVAAWHGGGEGRVRFLRKGAVASHLAGVILMLAGCASPGRDVGLEPGDFALLDFALQDCTSNDQHLGLEKFLRKFSGTVPQIDLDRQVARVRLVSPMRIDFGRLMEGFRRANTGLGEIRVTARCILTPESVILVPTGQSFPFAHDGFADPEPTLRLLRFRSWRQEKDPRADLEP